MTDTRKALESAREGYSYKTYRQEWRVNSVEVDQYDRNPRVYATKSFPTREEAEAHRLEIAKPHSHVEGRWVPNDAPHSYVDCYVQYTEVLSEKFIQTSDIATLIPDPSGLEALVERDDAIATVKFLQSQYRAQQEHDTALITALKAELDEARRNAQIVCDSYADENQRLFDRAETAERALTTFRALADRKEGGE